MAAVSCGMLHYSHGEYIVNGYSRPETNGSPHRGRWEGIRLKAVANPDLTPEIPALAKIYRTLYLHARKDISFVLSTGVSQCDTVTVELDTAGRSR